MYPITDIGNQGLYLFCWPCCFIEPAGEKLKVLAGWYVNKIKYRSLLYDLQSLAPDALYMHLYSRKAQRGRLPGIWACRPRQAGPATYDCSGFIPLSGPPDSGTDPLVDGTEAQHDHLSARQTGPAT